MKILFVDHETRLSGGQRDLVDLVRALQPHGVESHVALPGDGPLATALRDHGATVHAVAMGAGLRGVSRWDLARRPWSAVRHLGAAVRASARLRALARELRPAIVHSNSMKAHLLSVRAARATGAPLVWHLRDILEEGRLRGAFVSAAARLPDRVVCISEATAAPFAGSRAEAKVAVVYNGVRPEPISSDSVAAWRSRLGVGDGGSLVGIVGQIAEWKGQDVFVEAAALLAPKHPNVRFAIVGECLFPENEAEYEASLHRRVTEAGLDGGLTFAGSVDPVDPFMGACDVFVHASRLPEPFGRVLVEAMAHGTPVVTTAIGAGPELVTPETGLIVPPGDPAALADAIEGLLADPTALVRMSEAARGRAAEFDIARTGEGVVALWNDVLRGASGRQTSRRRAFTTQ